MMTVGAGGTIPFPLPSRTKATRGRSKKGFIQTVKKEARSVLRAVGKFVEKMGATIPPSPNRRRIKEGYSGPFVPPI